MQHAQVVIPPRLSSASRSLTTGAAAQLASCHRTTILRAIERGELEAVRLGRAGDYRIAPEALEEWLRPAGPDDQEEDA
jgi:excisionase family DNA binding protein